MRGSFFAKREDNMSEMGYKERFVELLVRSGVLLFGDFTTKSGRQSPYFVNTGLFRTGAHADLLSEFYAQALVERVEGKFDALFGPAYKGIPLCTLTAAALWRLFKVDVGYCFNRKEAKDHGEGGVIVGWQPRDGERIVLIEDVVTAGTAVREVYPILKAAADVEIKDMIISVNRLEKGTGGVTAVREIKENYGITVHSIVTVVDILEYLHNRPVDGKVWIDNAMRGKMEAYMDRYCVL